MFKFESKKSLRARLEAAEKNVQFLQIDITHRDKVNNGQLETLEKLRGVIDYERKVTKTWRKRAETALAELKNQQAYTMKLVGQLNQLTVGLDELAELAQLPTDDE